MKALDDAEVQSVTSCPVWDAPNSWLVLLLFSSKLPFYTRLTPAFAAPATSSPAVIAISAVTENLFIVAPKGG